jgi:hypothetical protein
MLEHVAISASQPLDEYADTADYQMTGDLQALSNLPLGRGRSIRRHSRSAPNSSNERDLHFSPYGRRNESLSKQSEDASGPSRITKKKQKKATSKALPERRSLRLKFNGPKAPNPEDEVCQHFQSTL